MKMRQAVSSYIRVDELEINGDCQQKLEKLYHMYMKHRFDLLGSGYVKIDYHICAKGFAGKRYRSTHMGKYEKKAKKYLKDPNYIPINWFVDFKSGFFFDPAVYDSKKKCHELIGKKQGVDIKCPWELGRFYHLVQLAVLAVAEEGYRRNIIKEFCNEVVDFIGMNPIGKTVQWSAVMDASIRMVNLLTSYDILRQMDHSKRYFDLKFEKRFEKFIRQSLIYVIENLESKGNHYLSDLTGVIFAAAYLPSEPWTDACLVFGVQELIEQVDEQFHKEGSHYEGSTSYHRLSAEFVIYATAIIYGVLGTERRKSFQNYDNTLIKSLKKFKLQRYDIEEKGFFPQWYLDRLYNMGIFTRDVLKQNNEIVQIGDNDSGYLLKLTPMGEGIEENVLDHRTLLSAVSGLFAATDYGQEIIRDVPLESSLICSLKKGREVSGQVYENRITQYGALPEFKLPYKKSCCLFCDETVKEKGILDNVQIKNYAAFGLLIVKSDRLFLSLVTDTIRGNRPAGHLHNDKMSIEVMIDGKYITRDIGGYIYTSAPYARNWFRSTGAHNGIRVRGREQNIFTGPFSMAKNAEGELLYCTKDRIIGQVKYDDVVHVRDIQLTDKSVVVTDYANKPFEVSFRNKVYSVGYGKLRRE